MRFTDSYSWGKPDSFFGVGVIPPNLYEQRPHAVYLGSAQGVPLTGWIEQASKPYSAHLGNTVIHVSVSGGYQGNTLKITDAEPEPAGQKPEQAEQ